MSSRATAAGLAVGMLVCLSLGSSAFVGGRAAPPTFQRSAPTAQGVAPVVTRGVATQSSTSFAWSACAAFGLAASFALSRAARPQKATRAANPRVVVAQAMGGIVAAPALPQTPPPVVQPAAPVIELSDMLGESVPEVLPATPVAAPVSFAPAATVFAAAAPAVEATASPLANGLSQPAGRSSRTRGQGLGGSRRERRRIGATLLQACRVVAEPRVISYDPSKVPSKLQCGLLLRSFPSSGSGREAKAQKEVQGTMSSSDLGSQTLFINRMEARRKH